MQVNRADLNKLKAPCLLIKQSALKSKAGGGHLLLPYFGKIVERFRRPNIQQPKMQALPNIAKSYQKCVTLSTKHHI